MFDKEKSKEELKKLIDKYNKLVESGKLKSYNEEMTKKDFILPLFRALGWDIENGDEVTAEEKVSRGRVDYAFRIGGIPKLFIEAKAIKVDLDRVEFAEQAINYAWHKGATWAILTDFEGVKVFNAEWKSVNPLQNMFFSISYHQFLDRFDQLLLLSRESLENGLIDKEAEKWGKKAKKVPVDKQLLSDMTKFRELLTKNILKHNSEKSLTGDELDEAVQRIIDRLIFIRTLEDKQLEAPMLQALIREDKHKKVYKKLNNLFRTIDDIYNSKLFRLHLCEELVIDDDILEKVIRGLFKTADNTVHYDFGAIDADVLGNIYEQYLGHILKKTAKRAKLTSGKAHRKKQGIYYTPTYVVDYIVKNTVGELAKNKKFDLKNIKVIDPACGSGSFLMKAFDYLVTLDKQRNGDVDQTKLDLTGASATYGRKVEILKNNIFGVDLDPKAVEIAQLNLLLKAAEKKHRLPTLQENIKVGNSLIDDSEIAGKKAFKWEEEFKEIMDEGGFDVVIGNPPYVRHEELREYKNFFSKKYSTFNNSADLFIYFIEKGLSLLKESGYFGFIVSNKFLKSGYGKNIREYISSRYKIEKYFDSFKDKVFQDASVDPCIIIIKKEKPSKRHKIKVNEDYNIEQHLLDINGWVFKSNKEYSIKNKIESIGVILSKYDVRILRGIVTGLTEAFIINKEKKEELISKDKRSSELIKPFLRGRDIKKYQLKNPELFIILAKNGLNIENDYPAIFNHLIGFKDKLQKRWDKGSNWYNLRPCDYYNSFEKPKIIYPDISSEGGFYYDSHCYYFNNTIYMIGGNIKKYWIGLLNSKLINWYYKQIASNLGKSGVRYFTQFVKNIPLIELNEKKAKHFEELVDKIHVLKKRLVELRNKQTDEKFKIEKEIRKLDNHLDQEVYNLYRLSKKEIKIIEESMNEKYS